VSDYAASFGTNEENTIPHNGMLVRGVLTTRSQLSQEKGSLTMLDVSDGTTNTILLAEKYLPVERYTTGGWAMEAWPTGAATPTARRVHRDRTPKYDADTSFFTAGCPNCAQMIERMGGPHSSGLVTGMADGSVRNIAYNIDPITYERMGMRNDGLVIIEP
jgi:hypothetical protein